jgi:DNA-binding transcriptional ArsR family regulator
MATLTDHDLDATFNALADSTRRAILVRLSTGEATVNELAEPFDLTLQAVSKHIKVLEHCGLVSRRREAQTRPCHLETERLDAAVDWIDEQRAAWNDRFDALGEHLAAIQNTTTRPTLNRRNPEARTR